VLKHFSDVAFSETRGRGGERLIQGWLRVAVLGQDAPKLSERYRNPRVRRLRGNFAERCAFDGEHEHVRKLMEQIKPASRREMPRSPSAVPRCRRQVRRSER
jgi:hypothetical protein